MSAGRKNEPAFLGTDEPRTYAPKKLTRVCIIEPKFESGGKPNRFRETDTNTIPDE
jgi:hypothetical protein